MYNGGIDYRRGFVSKALGLDKISSRIRDLVMFRNDEMPENHPLIFATKMAVLDAQIGSFVRIFGLVAVPLVGMIIATTH